MELQLSEFVELALEGAVDSDKLVERAVAAFVANTCSTPKAMVGFGWDFVKSGSIPDGGM